MNAVGLGAAPSELIRAAVEAALSTADGELSGELSVTLLDDDAIRALNAEYLERDRATDVIAFSLDDETLMGDVYIGYDRARAQAEEHGVTLDEELVRLAVHGTLHVLGHDHPEGRERFESRMFELQEELVRAVLAD